MSKTNLDDIRGLTDPLLQHNFDLIIPQLPGGGNTRALTIKCMTANIPGSSVDDVTITLKGIDVKYAGRQVYSHTLSVTYLETRDLSTRDALNNWLKLCRSVRDDTGSYKSEYATLGMLVLYDDTGSVVRTVTMDGFFIQNMEDSAVDGSAGNSPVTISATFAYDTWYDKI